MARRFAKVVLLVTSIVRLIFPIINISLIPREKTNLNKRAF